MKCYLVEAMRIVNNIINKFKYDDLCAKVPFLVVSLMLKLVRHVTTEAFCK
jgi:hypothetical protein